MITAGTNAWRKVEGVVGDRHRSCKRNGKMCVRYMYMYVLATMTLTEKPQETAQIYENTWVRRIEGVTRADTRRMEELREEVGKNGRLKTGTERRYPEGGERKGRRGRPKLRRRTAIRET